MEVRNCRSCGKIFNYLSGAPLCPTCAKALDEIFEKVKEYVYDNPGAGIQEVSEKFEISINQIKQWIREERLAFAENSAIGLECESCGALIKTGRFCKKCKDNITKGFDSLYQKKEAPEKPKKDSDRNPKMRFLDANNNNKQ